MPGIITMDKGYIMKNIYGHMLVDNTRIVEMAWSRIIEFRLKC